MIIKTKALVLTATLAGILGAAPAHAHLSYNVTGFAAASDGYAFSTDGSDGLWNASAQNTLATPQYIVAPSYSGGSGPSCGNATTGPCPPPTVSGSFYRGSLPVSWMTAMHAAANTPGEIFDVSTTNALTLPGAASNFQLAVSGNSTGTGMDFGYLRIDNAQNAPGYGMQVTVSADIGSALQPYVALFGGWDDSRTGADGVTATLGSAFNAPSTPGDGRSGAYSYANGALGTTLQAIGYEFANAAGLSSITFNFQSPTNGHYILAIGGANGTSGKYTSLVSTSTVPVPAAVWLFGSALMGYLGLQKRKMAA